MFNFIDKKIRAAFSDAALQYDALTGLHREIGRELIRKINTPEGGRILEVGMGTGWLTKRIKNLFPDCLVAGIDFADGMIAVAQDESEGYEILQADAGALPFKANSFESIVSNLSYQWIKDLPGAFGQCHASLKAGGQLCFTMFGRETFWELFEALEKAQGKNGKDLGIHRLPDKGEIEQTLRRSAFTELEISSERIKVRFPDMLSIIKWTKDIGANVLKKDFFVGKELLSRANDYYDKHFNDRLGIYTTFEVIWVSARK